WGWSPATAAWGSTAAPWKADGSLSLARYRSESAADPPPDPASALSALIELPGAFPAPAASGSGVGAEAAGVVAPRAGALPVAPVGAPEAPCAASTSGGSGLATWSTPCR